MRTDPNALATFAAVTQAVGRIAPGRNAAVADAGCGDGQLLDSIRAAGFTDLTGIGFAIPELAGAATISGIDLSQAGWAAKVARQFDVLIATDVIEHLENPLQFLREAAIAVQPGGALILTFPNVHNLRSILGYGLQGRPSGFFGPNLSAKPLFDQHIWMPNRHVVDFFLSITGFGAAERHYIHGRGRLFAQTEMAIAKRLVSFRQAA